VVTKAPALVVIIIIIVLLYFLFLFFPFFELRCVALLYVTVSYYLPFVLSLLVCGSWGSAAKLLMDTSDFSRAQRVGVCLHRIGSGIWNSMSAVGASGTRLRKVCVVRLGVRVTRSENV
jgi:hypothetical protein